jgi:hypothetical protein
MDMTGKKPPKIVSDYLAEIGRKGGESRVPKGFSTMDPARRTAIAKKAIEKRWARVRTKAKKAANTQAAAVMH